MIGSISNENDGVDGEVVRAPDNEHPDSVILSITGQLDPWLARKVLESAPAIIYVYDVKAERSIFQNRRLSELLGYKGEEKSEHESEWRRYIHPDDVANFPRHRARLKTIKQDETLNWQFRMKHADGGWRHFVSRDVLLSSDSQGAPWLIVGSTTDMTEQKIAEERKNVVLGEMRHRARNFASVMEGIGRQSLPRDNPAVKQFFQTLMGRLRALLDAGDVVLSSETRAADLHMVVQTTLAPFGGANSSAVSVDGPNLELPESTAGSLALALHELATNAIKHGALSQPDGKVSLTWRVEKSPGAPDRIVIEWKERASRPIAPPQSEGFGMRLIRNTAPRNTDSTVETTFEPDGLRCRMSLVLA